jgi:SpoIID/LytB domain protein
VLVTAWAVQATTTSAGALTTRQFYRVPASGHVVVQGHGWGHGHGMSQYGAQGAALQGLTYQQIVDFYYPGTTWSTERGKVRVLISGATSSDLVVSVADGLTVRDRGDGATFRLPVIDGATRWRLRVGAGNVEVVDYLTDAWHRYDLADDRPSLLGDGEFFADGALTLWTPDGAHTYRGALRAASPYAGSSDRDTVEVLSMNQYVRGVIPNEMPASWQTEAVKAQAVAARTYATWSRAQYRDRYYQICDTSSCQVYRGKDSEDPRSNAAVKATSRQILRYDGEPAFTQFGSSDGGWTAAGGVPYLAATQDPYDGFSGNPVHSWTTTLEARRIESAYPSLGRLRRIEVVSRDGHGDWGGRVWTMVLDGRRHDVRLSGDTFRARFGLRSTWFSFGRG